MSGDITSNSLQAGFIELASVVRALHGNWGSPAPGYDGWTCRDLLAHLSSTAASLPAVASSATEPKDPNAPEFDADRWNRGQVRRRADKEPQELIDEYDAGTTRLVAVLSDITLDAVVTIGPFAGDSVGESMAKMLQHQRSHLTDLEAALSPPA
ncbi:MAG: Mycothiol maleylpyruvate isomerase N-terminal domain [Chloroflexota bacterium]|nr:Mycothiol maleylpyruvate isomerase N-terminal domain [Chloroflexota bacterium]